MNIYLEIAYAIARAAIIAIGSYAVHRGWISAEHAQTLTGPAALWLAAGLLATIATVWRSIRNKIGAAATMKIARDAAPGTDAAVIDQAAKDVKTSVKDAWALAKDLHTELVATTAAKGTQAESERNS